MALSTILTLVLIISCFKTIISGDPDILSDFLTPPNITTIDGNFFTFTGMRGAKLPPSFKALRATAAEFPALNGQSVSLALLQFPPDSLNPPHSNARAAGLLFLIRGSLDVGLVDTANKLYTQTLQVGDMFVFPKGLSHYQYNPDKKNSAIAVAAFGHASAGTWSVPSNVFATGIDDVVLAKSFNIDIETIQRIKAEVATGAR